MSIVVTDYPPVTQFDLIDPTAISEAEFSECAVRLLKYLYPDSHIFKFTPTARYEGVPWKPDLALVRKDFKYWFVIEVEVASHSLDKHILPQVTGFVNGTYYEDAVRQLSTGAGVSEADGRSLLHYVPRHVAVVSNNPSGEWTEKLSAKGVQHLAISTYRNRLTQSTVHKVDGGLWSDASYIGFARVFVSENALLTKDSSVFEEGTIKVVTDIGVSSWTCVRTKGQLWLLKDKGPVEYPDGTYVQLLMRSDGHIIARRLYP